MDGPLYKYTRSQHSSNCFDIAVNCTSLSDGAVIMDLQFTLST